MVRIAAENNPRAFAEPTVLNEVSFVKPQGKINPPQS